MAGDLRVCVLGPVLVERDGVPVELGGPRQRAVLARLVLAGDRGVRPGRLLADVWGEESPAGMSSLHVSVSHLRKALEPGRAARTSSVLVSRSGGYALQVRTDAGELAEVARRGLQLSAADRLEQAQELFETGQGLWRGEPYDDVGEQPWLLRERARLHDLRLIVAEQLAEVRLRRGDSVPVALDLGPLVGQHPARERLAVLLAVALYRQSRQDEALDVLRRTRRHLLDTLGLDPGPELRAVEAAVLAQETDPLPQARPATDRMAPVPVAPPDDGRAEAQHDGDVLVGRERPRAVLAAAASAALTATPTFAVLVGEAGIGKTRLLQEIADDLGSQSWSVAWGTSTDGSGAPALWPWLSVLQQLREAAPLSPDLLALLDEPPVAPGPADPAAARWRQQRAVADHLARASQAKPVLVVLDDLHWADPATHVLLGELVAGLRGARVLVLVATRPGGPPSLTAVLARLVRSRALRLELGSLSADDVAALADAAGFPLDPGALRERTGGNPFLLQETLALAAQTGASPLEVVPATVADVLRARTELLPGDGSGVLAAAAVLGEDLDSALIAGLLDSGAPAVEATLDAAVDAGLLAAGPGPGLRFRHDLVRESCLATLGPMRRQRLHARAFELLRQRSTAGPARLASHALAAGPSLTGEAVLACTAAARDAEARLAHDSAVRWWSRAVEAADQLAPGSASGLVTALLGLVGAQLDAGDAVGALDTRARAVRAARDVADPGLRARALTALDRPLVWVLGPRQGVALDTVTDLEQLLSAWPAAASPLRCRLLATLAVELRGGSRAPSPAQRCDSLSAQALAIAEELGEPGLLAFALNRRQLAIAAPGTEPERAVLADRLVGLGRSASLPTVELAGHQLAAQARLQLFEVRAADEHAAQARGLAEQLQLTLPRLQQQLWDSSRLLLAGDLDGALALLERVREIDWPWWGRDAMLATVQLSLLLRVGAPERAAPLLEQTAYVHPRLAADAQALVLAHGGQRAAAEQLLRSGPPAPRDWTWRAAACVRAQAALAVGAPEEIEAVYTDLLPEAGLIAASGSIDAGPVDAHLADLADALGRSVEAAEHRARLVTLCHREQLPVPDAHRPAPAGTR